MRIRNLAALFRSNGFAKKKGIHPVAADAGFEAGPIDIVFDTNTGKIAKIEKTPALSEIFEPVFDASGLIATAGFLDSHTHTLFAGSRENEFFMRWSGQSYRDIAAAGGGIHNTVLSTAKATDHELTSLLEIRLAQMAAEGATHVEIKTGYGLSAAEELRHLRVLKKFRASTAAKSLAKISVTFLGLHALPARLDEAAFLEEMSSLLPIIRDESLAEFVDAFPEDGFFQLSTALKFAERAASLGLRAKIHADELSCLNSSESFAKRGALSVDHLQHISSAGIEALSKLDTVATLMPATSFFLGLGYADARKLLNAGARVALATDFNPGTAPELGLHFTKTLAASQLKMSSAEILCALTYSAAAALGRELNEGQIDLGFQADLCLWRTNTTNPSKALDEIILLQRNPAFVFSNGAAITQAST